MDTQLFGACEDDQHYECIITTDLIYEDGRIVICSCECHKETR